MTTITDHLNAFRTLVHEPPTASGWDELCMRLDRVQEAADLHVCLDYLDGHLSHWPTDLRQAPARWLETRLRWDEEPRWSIVRALTVRRPEGASETVRRLVDTGTLVGLSQLQLDFGSWQKPRSRATALDIAYLATSPSVAGLEALILDDQELGPEGAQYLGYSPRLAGLRSLRLRRAAIGDRGAAFLARSPILAQLLSLDLAVNEIGDEGALALAASTTLTSLETLELLGNHLSSRAAAALAASASLPACVTAPWQTRGPAVQLRAEVGGQRYTVFEGQRLGFGRAADVRLPSIRVPERHFEVFIEGGQALAAVTGPELRLVVNGERVDARGLRRGDRVASGPFEFVVEGVP